MSSTSSDRTPIVWLVNEAGHDGYKKAERYGRLVPLTSGSINPFAIDRLLVNLSQRLELAQEKDFIAISGLAILNVLVITIMLAKFERVNLLQWSTKKSSYVRLTLRRHQIERHALNPLGPAE